MCMGTYYTFFTSFRGQFQFNDTAKKILRWNHTVAVMYTRRIEGHSKVPVVCCNCNYDIK